MMKYFKDDASGEVFAYEQDGSQDEIIPSDLRAMTDAEIEAHLNPPVVVRAPDSVTMMQARMAMLNAGILDQVQASISAMTGTEGQAAQIQWQFAQEVRRDWPLVRHLQEELGLSDQQVDDLFIAAAGIQ